MKNTTNAPELISLLDTGALADIRECFLAKGGFPNGTDADGNPVFFRVIYRRRLEVADYLIEAGADIDGNGQDWPADRLPFDRIDDRHVDLRMIDLDDL